MFSVDNEDEAWSLVSRTCHKQLNGQYIAPELKAHQTLENLMSFGDRLAAAHERMKEEGLCKCAAKPPRLPKPKIPKKGKCYFCPKVLKGEHYCPGCKHFVCEECDYNLGLMGTHNVEDHAVFEDEMEED